MACPVWSVPSTNLASVRRRRGRPQVCANVSGYQMSGYLQRRTRQKWKRFWFVLRESVLYMYRASQDVVAMDGLPVLGYQVQPIPNVSSGNVLMVLALAGAQRDRTGLYRRRCGRFGASRRWFLWTGVSWWNAGTAFRDLFMLVVKLETQSG